MKQYLLLADDDIDDCIFFKEALEDIAANVALTTVKDGEELMRVLSSTSDKLPDVLFLDLNMPRKSGFECLAEIKLDAKLKSLPIIIFSTSLDTDIVNSLYDKGAHYYIRKPGEFSTLKKVINEVLTILMKDNSNRPEREKFILQASM